jgi:hypothetical protein
MNNNTIFESRTGNILRPQFFTHLLPQWEVLHRDGDVTWHAFLTDALIVAEGVTKLDDLSREARQFWRMTHDIRSQAQVS